MSSQLFFGVSAGRSGTMWLANLLNSEPETVCLHEGKRRTLEQPGEQVLEYLTLQNLLAYQIPRSAGEILAEKRAKLTSIAEGSGARRFGDIAYNYAPFVSAIPKLWPAARLVILIRDGREFVRSVVTDEKPDRTPVGWLNRAPVDKVERFVSVGRLRPRADDPLSAEWPTLSAAAKNAWLWAETNRLIFDGLAAWLSEQVLTVKFESFVAEPDKEYDRIRGFIGVESAPRNQTLRLLHQTINSRRQKVLPEWAEWTKTDRAQFSRFAGQMMSQLGYQM